MAKTLFTNVNIFDGTGKKSFAGEVLVQGNRIQRVGRGKTKLPRDDAKVVDGGGATLMPGLVNCHWHPAYDNAESLTAIGDMPPEENTLATMHNVKTAIDHGFTAGISAATSKPRIDVVIRNEINAGRIPGPRMLAASPEITVTGGLADERQMHMYHESVGLIVDGPEQMRQACRLMVREGVDILKVNNSGDNFVQSHALSWMTVMDDDEVAAAVRVANQRGKVVATHSRSAESIKQCLRFGINIIHHATLADEEALDGLEAKRDQVIIVPCIGLTYNTSYEAGQWGITPEIAEGWGFPGELKIACETMKKMHKRGIKVLPFGDYGFAWAPHGTETRDFEHFVNLLGFTPAETLRAATQYGGEAFAYAASGQVGAKAELGVVKEGCLADLIMLDGDPLEDITLFQDKDNILMIMKNGEYHKAPKPRRKAAQRRVAAAAE